MLLHPAVSLLYHMGTICWLMENYYSGLNSRMMLKQAEGIFSLNCSSNNSFLKRKKKSPQQKARNWGPRLASCACGQVYLFLSTWGGLGMLWQTTKLPNFLQLCERWGSWWNLGLLFSCSSLYITMLLRKGNESQGHGKVPKWSWRTPTDKSVSLCSKLCIFISKYLTSTRGLQDRLTLLFSILHTHLFLGILQNIFYCPAGIVIN